MPHPCPTRCSSVRWWAQQSARLESGQGDIDTLSGRIAAARTWSYIAHRADWLAHPAEMAERTRALEEKLSDALHAALTQRFVDRRTTVLLRDMGQSAANLPVEMEPDRSEEHTSELQSLMRISYAVFCLKKKKPKTKQKT